MNLRPGRRSALDALEVIRAQSPADREIEARAHMSIGYPPLTTNLLGSGFLVCPLYLDDERTRCAEEWLEAILERTHPSVDCQRN